MSKTSLGLIGAHTSTQGGAYNALYEGQEIGASTVQIFTSNQRQWKGKQYTQKELDLWKKAKEETGITEVMSHASYLINLASPKEEVVQKSLLAFEEEVKRCHALDIWALNFHPGACLTLSREEGLERIVQHLHTFKQLAGEGRTKLVFETTAGQGSTLGVTFEEIGFLVHSLKDELPVGVCIDTCHSFAAGYDIRTPKGWDETLHAFDQHVGLDYLLALHVNDSQMDFASRKDRHACLGEGKIGSDAFCYIMQDDRLRPLPKYLETPEGTEKWKEEIKWLKSCPPS